MTVQHRKPTVPPAYALLLGDVVARWNVSLEALLNEEGLTTETLMTDGYRLEHGVFSRLIERAIQLTGEPGLGFHLGLQMKVSYHGMIGYAAMVARTVRESLDVATQYLALQSSALEIEVTEEASTATVRFIEREPVFRTGDVGIMFLLTGFKTMGNTLTGHDLKGVARVTFPRPDYFDRFEHLMSGTILFSQPENSISFDQSYMDLPLVMSDPIAARQAREQCKQELHRLAGDDSLTGLVRELVFDEALGFSGIDSVAEKLNMTSRTLQRKLKAEGQAFREVVEGVREQRARELLSRSGQSVAEIADLLDYGDTTNFTRAFKRWTGQSPSEFRKEARQS